MATVVGQTAFFGVAPRAASKANRASSKRAFVCKASKAEDAKMTSSAKAAATVALSMAISASVDAAPAAAKAAAPAASDDLLEQLYAKSAGPETKSSRFEGTETAKLLAESSGKKGPAPKAAPAPKPVAAPKAAPVKAAPAPKPVPGKSAPSSLPEVKYAVPEPTKSTTPKAAPAPKAAPKPAAPKPKPAAPKPAAPKPAAPKAAPAKAAPVKAAPKPKAAPVAPGPKAESAKNAKANLAEVKIPVEATKGSKGGMQLNNEAGRPKTKLAALTAGAGVGAGLFGLGKAAGAVGAAGAKGGAVKAAAGATSVDAAEAAAVFVAGGAVGQTGTTIINKNSRIRTVRKTPKGELPLPAQTAVALSVPIGFLLTLISILAQL